MAKWTKQNIELQKGKVAVVTGANSGIGFETTLGLAEKGVEVILACRNLKKAEKAKASILKQLPNAQLKVIEIDTSRLESVKSFADEVERIYERVDVLINNAGIMMPPYSQTEDGFEKQFATNYLGHFALTGRLFPLLRKASQARIVSLSSLSYKWSEIQFQDLNFKNKYDKKKAYGQSKRACLVFAFELQRRLHANGDNMLSLVAHPGLSNTNLDRYFPKLIRPLGALFLQQSKIGALPVLYAALDKNIVGGEFIGPSGYFEIRGYPKEVTADFYSKNAVVGQKLWAESEQLTGVSFLKAKNK